MMTQPRIKSEKTFGDEFNFLLRHVPGSLDSLQKDTIRDKLNKHFDYLVDTSGVKLTRLPRDFQKNLLKGDKVQDIFRALLELPSMSMMHEETDYTDTSAIDTVRRLFFDRGTEALGFYLPMHQYFENKEYGWGIYIFKDLLDIYIKWLYSFYSKEVDWEEFESFFYTCIYRHLLFHFHTEHFATSHEVLFRKPFYLKYSHGIFDKHAYTEDWLEEALAEDAVLGSRLVQKRSTIDHELGQKIYRHHLSLMPAGYRDYECRKFRGPKEAHANLAAQIIHREDIDPLPTSINTVKREYIKNDKMVPGYLVTGLTIKRNQ